MRWAKLVAHMDKRKMLTGFREIIGFLFSGYRCSFRGRNTHVHLVQRLRINWALTLLPLYAFVARFSRKTCRFGVYYFVALLSSSSWSRFTSSFDRFWSHSYNSSSDLTSVQLGIVQDCWKVFCVMCKCWMKLAWFQNLSWYWFCVVSAAVMAWGLQILTRLTPTGL
jgi:hypothetical protein